MSQVYALILRFVRPRVRGFGRVITWVSMLLVPLLLSGCAPNVFNPFQVPVGDFRGSISRIAISPIRASQHMISQEEAKIVFEDVAATRLRDAGFELIPSETWEALWLEAASDIGGIYDTSTGEADEERFEIVHEAVLRALEKEHGADGVLYLDVRSEEAYNSTFDVGFCGARREAFFPSGNIERRRTSTGAKRYLKVVYAKGSCLNASLFDMEGIYLYGIRSPIEVFATYANQTRAIRNKEESLAHSGLLKRAVEDVIGPLADGAGPSISP